MGTAIVIVYGVDVRVLDGSLEKMVPVVYQEVVTSSFLTPKYYHHTRKEYYLVRNNLTRIIIT